MVNIVPCRVSKRVLENLELIFSITLVKDVVTYMCFVQSPWINVSSFVLKIPKYNGLFLLSNGWKTEPFTTQTCKGQPPICSQDYHQC